jgi:A/G-specific adenine glycosylase
LLRLGLRARNCRPLPPLRHTFTHFRLILEPVLCEVEATARLAEPGLYEWVALERAARAGVPTPVSKLLRLVASAAD